jgi:glycosyltransferase involved in cell wall biosynthesis
VRQHIRMLCFFQHPREEGEGEFLGGQERRFLETSPFLKALGVEIFALEYGSSLVKLAKASSYHPIKLKSSSFFAKHSIFETLRLIFHGLKSSVRFKIDVIYFPGFWESLPGIIPAYVVSLVGRKPLVVVFHHLRSNDFSERNPIRLSAYRHAKVIIAVSDATAQDVRRCFKTKRVVVTGNGVNLEIFTKLGEQIKSFEAVYFGRISEEKGIYTLLKAWSIVIKKMPSAKLLLIGGFVFNSKEICHKLCEDLGISRNAIFSGFVSDQNAVRMLGSSKIFVLPSQEEGFGLTVVEAMALGLPCILSDIPALRENFRSAAVFVKPNDAEGLAQAIITLLNDDTQCKKLGERGLKLARSFSWANVARKELEVLQSVFP